MYVPFFSESKLIGYHYSDPIAYKKNEHSHANGIISLSLSQLSKISRLLFELSVNKRLYLPTDNLYHQLSLSVSECKPEKAQDILNHVIEEFITATSGDFHLIKAYTTRFILLLYELLQEHHDVTKACKPENFQGHLLSSAETLGELKTCLDAVSQECINLVFPTVVYRHHQLLQKATTLIQQNYHQKLTQNMVASAVYLSPSYFSKVFKEAFGCTFNQYVNRIRIEHAKELLHYSVVSINSIPALVGFENRSYFGKIFKQLTGTTPKQYRNRSFK